MSAPVLSIEGATRRYRLARRSLFEPAPVLTAVETANLMIARGETLGIVGESGSGKSTLARMAMGFEAPDEGRVLFEGRDLATLPPPELRRLRQRFQMVFQDPYGSLDPRRTVGWSVAEPLRAIGIETGAAAAERARAALAEVGLSPADAEKYPHEFSGGQRQRVAIARAVVTRPALLVADEPVSALDVSVQAQILNLLMDLQERMGLAILFISHDLAAIAALADRIVVMREGRIVETGSAARVLSRPEADYTRSLIAAAEP